MKYLIVVLLSFAVVVVGFFMLSPNNGDYTPDLPTTMKGEGLPDFSWSYATSTVDSISYSEISLTATYENDVTEVKRIDRIEGDCNEYAERDADVYEKSPMIICYYAGLGRYFKVVQEEDGFVVLRKVFEEAAPDYTPPIEEYETVTRF